MPENSLPASRRTGHRGSAASRVFGVALACFSASLPGCGESSAPRQPPAGTGATGGHPQTGNSAGSAAVAGSGGSGASAGWAGSASLAGHSGDAAIAGSGGSAPGGAGSGASGDAGENHG